MWRRNKPPRPPGHVVVRNPFVIYPEITLPDPKSISIDSELVSSYLDFNKFWRNSTYHLGDGVPKTEVESLDIETLKPKKSKSSSFYVYLLLRPDNFPKELLGDTPRQRPVKRAKWRQDLQKLDVFEELEARYLKAQGEEEKGEEEEEELEARCLKAQGGEEKEEEEEDDDEEEESQGEEEESDHGDYDHNQDFDDDEDDYNQADGKNSSKDDNWFY